jgi:hypothetical protein
MGIRKLNDIITLDFTTHNSFTGAVQDTDLIPTCEIFEDDNDSAILTPTVTKRVGKTGNYRISIEATIGNGFEIGKSYNVIISATVNGISAKSRIESFVLDSKRIVDLNDLAQSQIISDSVPFAGASIDLIKIETNKIQPDIIDNKDAYKADVSSLALDATVAKEATLIDKASQSSVNAIKSDTESIIATLSTLVVDIWKYTTRTLTSFDTLVTDIALAVWSYTTRTITAGGITASEIWGYLTRTLTSGTKDSEIDAIKNTVETINTNIGNPHSPDIATDIENIQTIVDEIKPNVDLIKTETDKIKFILGLSQENYKLFDIVYSGDLITSTTIKTYPTANDCENNTNILATYSVIATYDSTGKLLTYKVKKE